MKVVFSDKYRGEKVRILELIGNFNRKGELFGTGVRNKIKIFPLDGKEVNIKSFKVPNLVNKIAYRFFRKSKAHRSFTYGHRLISKGIGTPYPIAYAEEISALTFQRSFYVSEHLTCDLTYRDLVQDENYPNREVILRAFTRFTFNLHEKQVEFLDHSPGNTLIKWNNRDPQFFLVDLNRMNFKEMDFETRMKNFSRLTPKKEMVEIMANEYSKVYKQRPESEIFNRMWFHTQDFQEKFKRKKAFKKKLKFWKK